MEGDVEGGVRPSPTTGKCNKQNVVYFINLFSMAPNYKANNLIHNLCLNDLHSAQYTNFL